MRFVSVPMKGIGAPTRGAGFQGPGRSGGQHSWPVFIHCRRGSDRTGTVLACYRISHDHWQNQKALEEAKTYGLSFFERAMRSFISTSNPAPGAVLVFSIQIAALPAFPSPAI